MNTKLYLLLCTLGFVSTSTESAIISLESNTGYPESYTHGAGVYAGDNWEDIDATCTGYKVGYVETGTVSVSGGDCNIAIAESTFNYSADSFSVSSDGQVSVTVQDNSSISSAFSRAGSIVDVNFSVDATTDYLLSVFILDEGHVGATGFESRIQLFENGALITDLTDNPTGSMLLQGTFLSGSTYHLITGVAVYGDTGWYPDSTGSGSASFNMSLALVPLPPAGLLFPFGLVIFALFKKRITH